MDELVKPVITMPTVLRDSGELIQCLEQLELPANCLLVTADGSSLYPNIDTKKAIVALDLLLREGKVAQTALLVQLPRLVFENNFLKSEFSDDIHTIKRLVLPWELPLQSQPQTLLCTITRETSSTSVDN